MEQQLVLQKKQLFWQRVCAVACLCIFLVVMVSAVLLVPQAHAAITELNQLTQQLTTVDWKGLGDSLSTLSKTAQDSLQEFNVDELNRAISDLQKAVAPLARLFGG